MSSRYFFTITRLVGLLLLMVFSIKFSNGIVRGIVSLKRDSVVKESLKDFEEKTGQETKKTKKAKKFTSETLVTGAQIVHCVPMPVDSLLKYHCHKGELADAIFYIHKPPPDCCS